MIGHVGLLGNGASDSAELPFIEASDNIYTES